MELRKVVDNLLIYDPEFQKYADKFVGEMGGSSAIQAVKTLDELSLAINGYTNVKFLEICLHGTPRTIHLPDGYGISPEYFGKLMRSPVFLQRNARILFDSCWIGDGEIGDDFMDKIGSLALKGRGGIIGASTVPSMNVLPNSIFCSDWYLKPFTDGKLKVRKYDIDGNNVSEIKVNRHGARVN